MIAAYINEVPPASSTPEAHDPAEVAAVQAALSGRLWPRLKLGINALTRVMKDPDDTTQVLVLFLCINARHVPQFMMRFLSEPDGLALMREQPSIDTRSVDFDALRKLPPDTLGYAFARHLDARNLSPDVFHAPPGVPPAFAYLGQRLRQSHDIWHVLTGYDTTVPDELSLLAFSHGQAHMPGPAVLAVLGALRWFPKHRDIFARVARGFRRGRAARSMITARWEDLWALPLAEVRARYAIAD